MRVSRVFLTRFVLLCFLLASGTDVLAKRPVQDSGGGDSCLSNRELNRLAKQALPELQAIDSTVTLEDVKNVIGTVGDCATKDAVSIVLDAYADDLRAGSQPTNSPPSISGVPNTSVAENDLYNFTPTASDPDGNALNFSIGNKPVWASFDASTGKLYGTPDSSYAGQTFRNIAIAVSDGSDTVSLPAFDLTVIANTTSGTAQLSWVAPLSKADGSPLALSELAGYRVYSGTTSDNLSLEADVNDASATTYTITGLASGTHCFAMTAYDYSNRESTFSNIITKTIP